jgi:hypothetical protein
LADGSVTAAKLADQSACLVALAAPGGAGAFLGQQAYATATGLSYTYTSTGWQQHAGVQTVDVTETGTPLLITQSGTTNRAISIDLDAQTAGAVWVGPATGADAKPSFRRLVSTDLPVATATVPGAVYPGAGVTVEADGKLQATPATSTALGGVSVPGPELQVSAGGTLTHAASGVVPGDYAKTTVNASGHVVGGQAQLQAGDIASVNASTVTTGTLPAAVIGDHSITAIKLADYATAYIQDVLPPVTGNTIGQLWLNPLAQQIRMWDGNVWVPIGVGALSEQNLRFCGLFDATSGTMTVLTEFGRNAGLTAGNVIPAATDQLTGAYFVADTAGNGAAVAAGISFDPGDWIVCLGVAQGWARVDTLSGAGGGGGGATTLDGLLDVDSPNPGAGQVLRWDGISWKPWAIPVATDAVQGLVELATQAEVTAGTDATRAVTPATLKQYVATASPAPVDATEAVKGVVQLADAASITAGTASRAVQASQLKTTNDTLATAVTNITNLQTSVTTLQGQTVDATTTVKGIVQLADAAAVTAGTAGRVVTANQLKTTNDLLISTLTGTAPVVVTGTGNTRGLALDINLLSVLP